MSADALSPRREGPATAPIQVLASLPAGKGHGYMARSVSETARPASCPAQAARSPITGDFTRYGQVVARWSGHGHVADAVGSAATWAARHAKEEHTMAHRIGRRQLLGSAAGVVTLVALTGAVLPSAFAAGTASVGITEPTVGRFAFTPAAIVVPAGTAITWTNETNAPHTVTADGGAFGSGVFNRNQSFRLVLTTPGAYTYYCTIHPYMHGSITVTPASDNAQASAQSMAPAASAPPAASPSMAMPMPQSAAPAAVSLPAHMPDTGGGGAVMPLRSLMGLAVPVLGAIPLLVTALRLRRDEAE